jgi:hypothetical protein
LLCFDVHCLLACKKEQRKKKKSIVYSYLL